jgi:hypothetical protein
MRLTNAGTFTGDIINDTTGIISVEGNTSAGMLLEGPVVGNVTNLGSISVTGDNSYGVRITAPVTGKVTMGGSVNVQGAARSPRPSTPTSTAPWSCKARPARPATATPRARPRWTP